MVLRIAGASLLVMLVAVPGPSRAGDWRSHYNTGKQAERSFENCCGEKDCRTWASLGYPKIVRRDDRGYNVRVEGHLLSYDFPAVHASHDDNTWVCYLKSNAKPDPLCLFLPPCII